MTAVNIATHALNAVYVITNVLLTGVPVRALHFFHGIVYAVTYVLFTLFYYLAGGTNEKEKPYVYSVIDWRSTGFTIGLSIGVSLVAVPLCHIFFWGLYHIRLLMFGCCKKSASSSELTQSSSELPLDKVP